MRVYYCDNCGRRVSEADIKAGRGMLVEDFCYCAQCAPRAATEPEGEVSLDDIVSGAPTSETASEPVAAHRPAPSRRLYKQYPAYPSAGGGRRVIIAIAATMFTAAALLLVYGLISSNSTATHPAPPKPVSARPADFGKTAPPVSHPEPSSPEPRGATSETPAPLPSTQSPSPARTPSPAPDVPSPAPATSSSPENEEADSWISIFNGKDLNGWEALGGKASVEDGAIVSSNAADLVYKADWSEFILKCDLKGIRGNSVSILTVGLAADRIGRGSPRVWATFFADGDIHVRSAKGRLWKAGSTMWDPGSWNPVTFKLTRDVLEIYVEGELMGSIDISSVPVKRGGVYFYSSVGAKAFMRNPRVKVLAR